MLENQLRSARVGSVRLIYVFDEFAVYHKSLSAMPTIQRLVRRVYQFVPRELGSVLESLPTLVALEMTSLTVVDALVYNKIRAI